MKTLKSLSVLTAAVLSNSLSLNAASDAANKPNFVIIFCDDCLLYTSDAADE